MRISTYCSFTFCFFFFLFECKASSLLHTKLRSFVQQQQTLLTTMTPGIAIAIGYPSNMQEPITWVHGVTDLNSLDPISTNTYFPIGSLSKVFTTTAIMMMIDRGIIGLNDAVAGVLPELGWNAQVMISDLMTHTSSLPYLYSNLPLESSYPDLVQEIIQQPAPTPSAEFLYSNIGIALLGEILQRTTQSTFEDFIQTYIGIPLNLGTLYFNPNEVPLGTKVTGYQYQESIHTFEKITPVNLQALAPAGSIWANVIQLYRFFGNHAKATLGQAVQLPIRSNTLESMHAPLVGTNSEGEYMGLGIFSRYLQNHLVFYHQGSINGAASIFMIDTQTGLTVVMLANNQRFPIYELAGSLLYHALN